MSRLKRLYDNFRKEQIAQLDLERVTEHREKVPKKVIKYKWIKFQKV